MDLTAPHLQSRISLTTTHLIQRMETILFQALAPSPSSASASTTSTSHTQTAIASASIRTETDALISAAQEIMALTRVLKGVWVAGGLDVLERPKPTPPPSKDETNEEKGGKGGEDADPEEQGRRMLREVLARVKERVDANLTSTGTKNEGDDSGANGAGDGRTTHIKEESGSSGTVSAPSQGHDDGGGDGDGGGVDIKMET